MSRSRSVVDPTVVSVTALLRAREPVAIRLWGHSMWPLVLAGARLRFEPCSLGEVRIGDVVLVARGGTLTAHRVVHVDDGGVRTWGDALRGPDVPVRAEHVIGRAAGVPIGYGQLAIPDRLARPANVALGALGRRIAWARRLAAPRLRGWAPFEAPPVRALRRALQPFRIEALTPAWSGSYAGLSLRAGQRADADALRAWDVAARGEGAAWVALRQSEPIGWLRATRADDGVWLRLWVARRHRGIGVGSALLDALFANASARGWERLQVRCDEPRARWFERRGLRRLDRPRGPDGLVAMEWAAGAT